MVVVYITYSNVNCVRRVLLLYSAGFRGISPEVAQDIHRWYEFGWENRLIRQLVRRKHGIDITFDQIAILIKMENFN